MPAAAGHAGDELDTIESFQAKCETSLEAKAIRYAQTSCEPVAVIRSEGGTMEYAVMSGALRDFQGIDWIRKGTPVPPDSVTADFNADTEQIAQRRRASGQNCLQDWLNGPRRQEIIEEVIGLGSYGKTLTVLTGMESPDETEDDESSLEEAWAVRFS